MNWLFELAMFKQNYYQDKIAIIDYDNNVSITYKLLKRNAAIFSDILRNNYKVTHGQAIGFISENRVELLYAFFSSYTIGNVLSVYNYNLKPNDINAFISNEKPRIIFYEAKFQNHVDILSNLNPDILFVNIEDLNFDECEFNEIRDIGVNLDDTQFYMHTGGTTGTPKTACISFRAILTNAISEIYTWELSSSDSTLVMLPLFHTAGWNDLLLPLLFVGGTIVLTKRFNPKTAIKIFKKYNPTVGIAVPAIYNSILEDEEFDSVDWKKFRFLVVGAAPITQHLVNQYAAKGVKLTNGYGMTEVGPNNIIHPMNNESIELLLKKWNSIGKPMLFNNVRIIDEFGNDVKVGNPGELVFKGPMNFTKYLNNPEETEQTIHNGWVHTGDIAYIDDEGYYYLIGRKKIMYISGGENIFPLEIEQIILQFNEVMEVCVFGVYDHKWGEIGKALLVVSPLFKKEKFLDYINSHISAIKRPRYYQIVERIPKNDVGKIDYSKIVLKYSENTPNDLFFEYRDEYKEVSNEHK